MSSVRRCTHRFASVCNKKQSAAALHRMADVGSPPAPYPGPTMLTTGLTRQWCFASIAMAIAGGSTFHAGAAAAATTIDIVVSEATGVYTETAGLVRAELAQRAALRIIPADSIAAKSDAALTIALGTRALQAALAQ